MVHLAGLGRRIAPIALAGLALVSAPSLAAAHHAMGGATPATFTQGLLSGLGHPVIGFDHLAFVVAAGIATALTAHRALLAALFVGATILGCLGKVSFGITLPITEIVIAASVFAIGGFVMSGRNVSAPVFATLFAAAGLFHGNAYAGSIVGAEITPLAAYLIGFAVVQFIVMMSAAWFTRALVKGAGRLTTEPRLAGAMVAGVGATFLIEHIEKAIFPGL
jgi:urease accessory protein